MCFRVPCQQQRVELARLAQDKRVVWFEARVEPADWAQRTRREHREIVGAWLRRASALFPAASCVAMVHADGRLVLEAIWSDLAGDVRFYQR